MVSGSYHITQQWEMMCVCSEGCCWIVPAVKGEKLGLLSLLAHWSIDNQVSETVVYSYDYC